MLRQSHTSDDKGAALIQLLQLSFRQRSTGAEARPRSGDSDGPGIRQPPACHHLKTDETTGAHVCRNQEVDLIQPRRTSRAARIQWSYLNPAHQHFHLTRGSLVKVLVGGIQVTPLY